MSFFSRKITDLLNAKNPPTFPVADWLLILHVCNIHKSIHFATNVQLYTTRSLMMLATRFFKEHHQLIWIYNIHKSTWSAVFLISLSCEVV